MRSQTHAACGSGPPRITTFRRGSASSAPPGKFLPPLFDAGNHASRRLWTPKRRRMVGLSARPSCIKASQSDDSDCDTRREILTEILESSDGARSTRRQVLAAPVLAMGASFLLAATTRAEDKVAVNATPSPTEVKAKGDLPVSEPEEEKKKEEEDVITSRIYDATVIGEPLAIGKDKWKVWEKLMSARVVYLGEAEQVPIRDDRELELEMLKNMHRRCIGSEKRLSLALEAFPSNLQEKLDQYIDKKIDGETLKSYTLHWPPQRWQEYEPLFSYCRDNEIRLVACGTPPEVLRTVQAEGVRGLSRADRKLYVPPAGSGFISGFTSISRRSPGDVTTPNPSIPFSYLSAQARVVEDYTMSRIILQNVQEEGAGGMLVVVTGASHITYGSRGTGVPARISRKMQKKNQVVILLDPERQLIRREGEVPIADFLWYSAARPCSRNCFDRAEVARIMNAAGRKRDALPQDLQKGIDLGLVSPEVLQNFFDLEQYPLISELTHRFQGFRERLLADPRFLNRLAIEEAISITTTLIAQYEKRKENFFEELDYVITDAVRGSVVDFFTVWLPAPTLSFLSYADEMNAPDNIDALRGLLGSIPDNAFQKSPVGTNWDLNHRVASVLFGGLKLASVGFISSIGTVASSNALFAIRRFFNPAVVSNQRIIRSPILKTAVVYASFLGISANLRYQIIAGVVEHRLSEQFSSQTLLLNIISFVARTINSYLGTQQWIDLARSTGLQVKKTESSSLQIPDSPNQAAVVCNETEEAGVDDIQSK
ncbi:protein RETICULATA-RELATED 5, chloroplastic-like [Neltuma alba]|uniref:protein RETICULATA-RELATED 5, chloroplastic-like n=1 Tax=Neltuma alba TaxID=207710 RepID=UPI0010A5740D|nr:protein RETICULATA-RELATED 5, chloroplastic-like [Prosopis alba]